MIIKLGLISILIAFSSSALSATSCEQYVRACVDNKNNRMGEMECTCVWKEALNHFNANQLAFLLNAAAKNHAKTQALMVKLGQQVAPVMQFIIMQPPKCLQPKKKTPSQDSPAGATSAGAAADAVVEEGETPEQ